MAITPAITIIVSRHHHYDEQKLIIIIHVCVHRQQPGQQWAWQGKKYYWLIITVLPMQKHGLRFTK